MRNDEAWDTSANLLPHVRNGAPKAFFIPNKLQAYTRLSRELLSTAETLGLPLLPGLHLRQAYADAVGQGTVMANAKCTACGRRDISPFRFNQRAMQRRSLIKSLSEEERAFVEAGKPQSTRQTVPPLQQPVANEEQPVQKKPAPAKKLPSTTALPPVLVSQTYRLPADLVKELIKVAVSRKLDRTAPWSQQDIVADAIRDWLTKQTCKHVSFYVAWFTGRPHETENKVLLGLEGSLDPKKTL